MAHKKAKKVKVRDLKPKKDAKGGGQTQHGQTQHGPRPNMFYFGGLTN
jgi:hypothetical protein